MSTLTVELEGRFDECSGRIWVLIDSRCAVLILRTKEQRLVHL